MTLNEIKWSAQEELLLSMRSARSSIRKKYAGNERDQIATEASTQMARVEKLFGVSEYSFLRGGYHDPR